MIRIITIVFIMTLATLAATDTCVETFYDVDSSPVTWEPNEIVGKPLGTVVHYVGSPMKVIDVNVCDPDTDVNGVSFPVSIALIQKPDGATLVDNGQVGGRHFYELDWQPTDDDVGDHYIVLRATDTFPPDPNQVMSVYGTILVQVRHRNRPPVFQIKIH